MPVLFFPNLNALRLALVSGLVPREISGKPASAGFDSQGRLWLQPAEHPGRDTISSLARFGVQTLGVVGVPTSRVSSWAELLPLTPAGDHLPELMLFLAPDRVLPGLLARLARTPGVRFGVRLSDSLSPLSGLVTVSSPPPHLTSEFQETGSPIESFAEQVPGVWVQSGWVHAAPDHLRVPAGSFLLLRPPRSVVVAGGTVPRLESTQYNLTAVVPQLRPAARQPVSIPARIWLAPIRSDERESLWVLDDTRQDVFWDFCAEADERLIRRLEVACVGCDDTRQVLVRFATPKREVPPPLAISGYAPAPHIPGLYLPTGRELRPHLRARELSRALGVGPGRLVWLEVGEAGNLVSHTIEERLFRPLVELMEYTHPVIAPLAVAPRSDLFPFERIAPQAETIAVPDPDDDQPAGAEQEEPVDLSDVERRPGWLRRSVRALLSRLRVPHTTTLQSTREPESSPLSEETSDPGSRLGDRKLSSPDAILIGHDWAARRQDVEERLVRELPILGPDGRADCWAELAALYSATGNSQDAAVCWMNAVWESPAAPISWLESWLTDECRAAKLPMADGGLDRWLSEPGRAGVGRVVAAFTALAGSSHAARDEFVAGLPRILNFLDHHFDDLPVRAAWLARLAAARACNGDVLGLARWRDRVLARLDDRGPGLDLDEPSFLRFHGTASAERFQVAREWLVRTRESAVKWVQSQGSSGRLQWAGLDAETDATSAYAQFMFAWGLACLGERTKAMDWAARARKQVARATSTGADPTAHVVLSDLFLLRVKDAQEGRPPKPGLPHELASRIDRLPEIARYSIDRLREHSRILEPVDRVRAFRQQDLKVFWGTDLIGERLSILAVRPERDILCEEARDLLKICDERPGTTTVPRVVLALLEVAPRLDPATVALVLDLLPDALAWTESWLSRGPWSADERARALAGYQFRMIEGAFLALGVVGGIGHAASELVRRLVTAGDALRGPLLKAAGIIFRSLRRYGLHADADLLVRHLNESGGVSDVSGVMSQLGLATGWYTAGHEQEGNLLVDRARELLFYQPDHVRDSDRAGLALSYAEALGFAPPQIAHGRLGELFQRLGTLKIDGTTNRYFTLRPLQIVDTVLRAVVTDDFALGPLVRGWLDDDEFLMRSRIHRDLSVVLREQELT